MATGNIIIPGGGGTGTGRVSLGTVADMMAAQQQQAALAATTSQNAALARARLGGLPTPNVGAVPGGATGLPDAALNPRQAAMMQQLQGNAPAALEGGAPISQPWRASTQNFPAVESPIPMTRAGAVNAARAGGSFQTGAQGTYGGPALADTLANDVSALRGGGVSGVPAAAGEASGFARYFPTLAGAAEGEGMVAKGAGFLAGGSKIAGLAKGVGIGLGAPIAGQLLGAGSDAIGAPSEVGGALRGAGTGVGIGSIFGAPGMVVGGTVGGAVGALSGPAQDLGWAEHYDDEADKTVKYARTLAEKGHDDIRHKFGNATQAIQRGNNDKFARVTGLSGYDVSTMQGRALALQALNKSMELAAAHPKHWQAALDTASGKTTKADKKKQTATQIQMGEAMARLGAGSVASGNAQAESLRNLATDPNMAAVAPVLQNSANQRAAMGQQMSDALTSQAYADLGMQKTKAQDAYIAQLEQQLQAARISGQSSSSSSSLADQVKAIADKTG